MTQKAKKFRRRFNPRLVKFNANYSTRDIVDLFHVHVDTVNNWYEHGLKTIDKQKPFLTFGRDLIDFLFERNKKAKKKSGLDELFCCKCKAPRKTQDGVVKIKIINTKKLMIEGICMECGTKMNKLSSVAKINEIKTLFNIQAIQEEHLLGCAASSVTTDKIGAENDKI